MTWKTPGVWDVLPRGAKVRAELAGTILVGTLKEVSGEHRDKHMDLDAFPPLTTRIFARDGWEVTYHVQSLAEALYDAPIAAVFQSDSVRYIKVTSERVVQHDYAAGYEVAPSLMPISALSKSDSTKFQRVAIHR